MYIYLLASLISCQVTKNTSISSNTEEMEVKVVKEQSKNRKINTSTTISTVETTANQPFIFHPLDEILGFKDKETSLHSKDTLVYLERTTCIGLCPVYQVVIYDDGFCLFNGNEDVHKLGLYKSYLTKNQLNEISATAEQIFSNELVDNFTINSKDLPEFSKTIIRFKNYKTQYRQDAPLELYNFVNYVDNLLKKESWERLSIAPQ